MATVGATPIRPAAVAAEEAKLEVLTIPRVEGEFSLASAGGIFTKLTVDDETDLASWPTPAVEGEISKPTTGTIAGVLNGLGADPNLEWEHVAAVCRDSPQILARPGRVTLFPLTSGKVACVHVAAPKELEAKEYNRDYPAKLREGDVVISRKAVRKA